MRYFVRTVKGNIQRLNNVEKLKERIPNLEVFIDTKYNAYYSFLEVCKKVNETGSILLEDDIELCDNFCILIEKIINEKGLDKVYNFFEKPKNYFKTSYVSGGNFLWMQCIYLPPKFPDKILKYYDEFREKPERCTGMATDTLIRFVLVKEKIKYWRIRPCLVQHLNFRSVIQSKRSTTRQSPYYIELLKEKGINYNDM